MQMAIRAVTGVLQGLATENTAGAIVGGLSPYANKFIKEQTGDNQTANLMAHAILGAIEAKATGNNPLAGATGAVGSEVTAKLITEKLYNKPVSELTEKEKETVSTLSQIAGGLAGGAVGDSTQSGVVAAEIGERAVEDNFLNIKQVLENPEYVFSLETLARGDEIKEDIEKKVAEEVVDKTVPHYISASVGFYGIDGKLVVNTRNGDVLIGGDFSPVVLPSRISANANLSLGWIINLDDSDRFGKGHYKLGETISNSLKGAGISGSGCYGFYCVGGGKSISIIKNDKTYKTIELGVGYGGSGGSISEGYLQNLNRK